MLLLYPKPTGTMSILSSIYIPLCFYFIQVSHGLWLQNSSIYIPLCFYFIRFPGMILSPCCINLHSTMLLLYPDDPEIELSLYDAFTFHYASTLSNHTRMMPVHSIPFTFHYASTLSWIAEEYSGRGEKFTFHYASTLSCNPLRVYSNVNGFTFHYASTLSLMSLNNILCSFYLHSTMLLLYQQNRRQKRWHWQIYIPLCFYFIADPVPGFFP